jgi:gliding motility-associated-like protein
LRNLKILLFTIFLIAFNSFQAFSQIPTKCLVIESILVDACGTPEQDNEMVRLRVGPNPIPIQNISFDWNVNSWMNFCQNATTATKTAQFNTNNNGCGIFIEPSITGNLPAGARVLLITSVNVDVNANPFNNLNDTVYLLFQCAGNTQGHFGNYNASSGLRATIVNVSGANGCADTLTYERNLLTNQSGGSGGNSAANDGARVDKNLNGVLSYVNQGCNAPLDTLTVEINNSNLSACGGDTINLSVLINNSFQAINWSGGTGIFGSPNNDSTNYILSVNDNANFFIKVAVTDLCGNIFRDSVLVTINASSQASISPQGNLCPYNNPVQLSANPNTGIWSSSTSNAVSSGGLFDPSIAGVGVHEIIFEPSGNCIVGDTITITVDSLPDASFTIPTTLCDFQLPYTISAVNAGSWLASPNPFAINQSGVFNPSTAGTYNIIHGVNINCINADTVTVIVTNAVTPVITPTSSNICVGDSVNIQITPIGVPWTISNVNGFDSNTGIFDSNISGTGNFTITYHDSTNCYIQNSTNIIVNNNFQANILNNIGSICENSGNIALQADSIGGIWTVLNETNGIINGDELNVNGLSNGNYTIVYDLQGNCALPDSLNFNITSGDTAIISGNSQFCSSDAAFTFSINVAGGNWNISPNTTAFNNGILEPSQALVGNYEISYNFPAGSCNVSDTFNIEIFNAQIANISPVNDLCEFDNPVQLQSSIASGVWSSPTAPLALSTNGIFGPSIAGNGSFEIVFQPNGNCVFNDTITINVDTTVAPNILNNINSLCENSNNITLQADIVGGVWSVLNEPNAVNSNDELVVGNLNNGNYSLIYAVSGSCNIPDTLNFSVINLDTVNIVGNTAFCSSDVPFTFTNNNGIAGTWSILPNNTALGANGIFDPSTTGAGNYSIIFNPSTSLCALGDTLNITVTNTVTANLTAPNTVCEDDAEFQIISDIPNGIWSVAFAPNSIDSNGIFDPSIEGSGTFEINYQLSGNCQNGNSIIINVLEKPFISISQNISGNIFCNNEIITLTAISNTNNIIWSNGTIADSIVVTNSGTYIATASNSCGTASDSVVLAFSNVVANFDIDVYSGNVPLVVNFTNNSSNANTFLWNFGDNMTDSSENAAHVYYEVGQFPVTLIASDSLGCSDTLNYEFIDVEEEILFFIPNVFTPNEDELNDVFKVVGSNIIGIKAQIFNRWGALIYEWDQTNGFWDGRTTSGAEATVGTYTYIIDVKFKSDSSVIKVGHVTLLR